MSNNSKIGALISACTNPFISFEFFPPAQPENMPDFFQAVERLGIYNPLFVSVTYGAGGAKQKNTLALTSELAKRGFTTMAHLTCVGASRDNILEFIDNLQKAHVSNVLALRGDPPRDREWDWESGHFRHASDLVSFIRHERPEIGIGVAAYPAPHPESPSFEADRTHTALKFSSGADFAISQLFFDTREYEALVTDLRKRSFQQSVIPGIITIQSFGGLKRVLSLCGANIPAKLYIDLEEANEKGGAEAVREAGIKFTLAQIKQLQDAGAPGFHLYTLNRSELCSRILEESGLATASIQQIR